MFRCPRCEWTDVKSKALNHYVDKHCLYDDAPYFCGNCLTKAGTKVRPLKTISTYNFCINPLPINELTKIYMPKYFQLKGSDLHARENEVPHKEV